MSWQFTLPSSCLVVARSLTTTPISDFSLLCHWTTVPCSSQEPFEPRSNFHWLPLNPQYLLSWHTSCIQDPSRSWHIICVIPLTYWIWGGGAATAVWVNIMVSYIKTKLISLKYIHCKLKEAVIQTHIINNPPPDLSLHHRSQSWSSFEVCSRPLHCYLTLSNRFWSHLTK